MDFSYAKALLPKWQPKCPCPRTTLLWIFLRPHRFEKGVTEFYSEISPQCSVRLGLQSYLTHWKHNTSTYTGSLCKMYYVLFCPRLAKCLGLCRQGLNTGSSDIMGSSAILVVGLGHLNTWVLQEQRVSQSSNKRQVNGSIHTLCKYLHDKSCLEVNSHAKVFN